MVRLPILLCAALAVGCATTATPPPSATPAPATFELVESTRPLFTAGQSWTYAVERQTDDGAAEPSMEPAPVDRYEARCSVAEQRSYDDASVASLVRCEDDELPIQGVWLRTARGLYLSYANELPPDAAAIAEIEGEADTLVLAAPPVALQTAGTTPDGVAEWSYEVAPMAAGAGWCSTRVWLGGDISGATICLSSQGPVSGESWFDGGMHTETRFERIDR